VGNISSTATAGNISNSAEAGTISSFGATNKMTATASLLLKSEGSASVTSTAGLTLDGGISTTLKASNSLGINCPAGSVSLNGALIKLG